MDAEDSSISEGGEHTEEIARLAIVGANMDTNDNETTVKTEQDTKEEEGISTVHEPATFQDARITKNFRVIDAIKVEEGSTESPCHICDRNQKALEGTHNTLVIHRRSYHGRIHLQRTCMH